MGKTNQSWERRAPARLVGAVTVLLTVCLLSPWSHAAVTATPATVAFTTLDQSVTIKLTKDGAPIAAADIHGWRLLASGHDYKHMLKIEKMDGALTIAPSKTIEVGSYDLTIETAEGSVSVQVLTPLSDMPDNVEKMAALMGLSEQKVEEKMGLTSLIGREGVTIDLPPVYYEGQTLELSMPVKPGRSYAWFMNGDLVAEGADQNTLSYTFEKPGVYVLTYFETEKDTGETIIAVRAQAHTQVATLPAVPAEAVVGSEMPFSSPAGYQKFVWRIDGKEVSTEPTLKHVFRAPGVYIVECVASSPVEGPEQEFLRIRYDTTVRSKGAKSSS